MSPAPERVRDRRFAARLAVVVAFALALRVAYLVVLRHHVVTGDGTYYHAISNLLADGKGFIDPRKYALEGRAVASAVHPPLWPLVLAAGARLGVRTLFEQQLVAALIGAATVAVMGYAGRALAGARAGLIAAALAAVVPSFVIYERELLSETLAMFGVAVTLLLAFRFQRQPGLGRALAVGALCGLLALTHSDQVLLIALLLVPLVLLAPGVPWRRRWAWFGAAAGAALVVIAPWSIYNTARFGSPVLLSTQLGPTLVDGNCDVTYYGARLGAGDDRCRAGVPSRDDEAARDAAMRRAALDYIGENAGRVPIVVAAREGRAWGLFRPRQQMHIDISRGTPRLPVDLGFVATWGLEAAAIVGVVVLRRRRVPLFPLMAVIVTVVIAVALTYGMTRYRAAADVPLVLLAAVALDAAYRRYRRRRATSTSAPSATSVANETTTPAARARE